MVARQDTATLLTLATDQDESIRHQAVSYLIKQPHQPTIHEALTTITNADPQAAEVPFPNDSPLDWIGKITQPFAIEDLRRLRRRTLHFALWRVANLMTSTLAKINKMSAAAIIRDQLAEAPEAWRQHLTQEAEKLQRAARIEAAQATPFDEIIRRLKGTTSMILLKVWCEGPTDRPLFAKLFTALGEREIADTLDFVAGWPTVLSEHQPDRWLDGCRQFCDVLVLYDRKILILQCKSKTLTHAANIGKDVERLRSDLQKGVKDAFDQGVRARDHLLASAELGLFPDGEPLWSLSLGALDVLTLVLHSPVHLLHYLNRRLQIERTSFAVHADEMDLLGYYLVQGMYFSAEELSSINALGIAGLSAKIDKYVFERFELGLSPPIPKAPMPPGFEEFLNAVEQIGGDYSIDCGIALLDLSYRGRSDFMESVRQAKSSANSGGKPIASMLLQGGKTGLSFLALPAGTSHEQLSRDTMAQTMIKKHAHKCDQWFSFGWVVGSTREVDSAGFLAFPWQPDSELDRLIQPKS